MKRETQLLRRYIREAIDLGNIQFSPSRLDGAEKTEPNTPEEDELYNSLYRRVSGIANVDSKTAEKLSQLIDSEKYGTRGSGFFQGPPPNTTLYRGHAVGREWVRKHIPANYSIKTSTSPRRLVDAEVVPLKTPYVFEERRGWTYKPMTASIWAIDYAMGTQDLGPGDNRNKNFAVVYVINIDDVPHNAMLDFQHSVYKTSAGDTFANEQEVMNLFPITVTSVKIIDVGATIWGSASGDLKHGRGRPRDTRILT